MIRSWFLYFASTFFFFTDEKEKYDPTAFRDSIIAGLGECGNDLEQVSRYLDKEGSKLDYRRYAEVLFDILFAGGILGNASTVMNNIATNLLFINCIMFSFLHTRQP